MSASACHALSSPKYPRAYASAVLPISFRLPSTRTNNPATAHGRSRQPAPSCHTAQAPQRTQPAVLRWARARQRHRPRRCKTSHTPLPQRTGFASPLRKSPDGRFLARGSSPTHTALPVRRIAEVSRSTKCSISLLNVTAFYGECAALESGQQSGEGSEANEPYILRDCKDADALSTAFVQTQEPVPGLKSWNIKRPFARHLAVFPPERPTASSVYVVKSRFTRAVRSLVARLTGGQKVAGSNPVGPI